MILVMPVPVKNSQMYIRPISKSDYISANLVASKSYETNYYSLIRTSRKYFAMQINELCEKCVIENHFDL